MSIDIIKEETNIHYDRSIIVPMSNYRQDPRLNQSTLKLYLENDPEIARWYETNPKPPTIAMALGTAVHTYLEKRLHPNAVLISPYSEFRTNEAKAWRDAHPHAMKDFEAKQAMNMADSVITRLPKILLDYYEDKASILESEHYTEDRKVLLDVYHPGGIGIDWKTTSSTNLQQFRYDCKKYNYALQAAWYMDVSKLQEFYFVGISVTPPHPLFVLRIDPESKLEGRKAYEKAMRIRASAIYAEQNNTSRDDKRVSILDFGGGEG